MTKRGNPIASDAAGWRREAQRQRKYLSALTRDVRSAIGQLDSLMKQPSTVERGRHVARILNALEMTNDQARYFGLGEDYRKDGKR